MDDSRPLLPVVEPEIAANIHHHYFEQDGDALIQHDTEVIARFEQDWQLIQHENPQITEIINELSGNSKDPVTVTLCGIVIYLALRSQSEADRMN